MMIEVGGAVGDSFFFWTNVKILFGSIPDNDKENDNRTGVSGQSTQGVIQRRRRPKRRSTGVVHIDMDVSKVHIMGST